MLANRLPSPKAAFDKALQDAHAVINTHTSAPHAWNFFSSSLSNSIDSNQQLFQRHLKSLSDASLQALWVDRYTDFVLSDFQKRVEPEIKQWLNEFSNMVSSCESEEPYKDPELISWVCRSFPEHMDLIYANHEQAVQMLRNLKASSKHMSRYHRKRQGQLLNVLSPNFERMLVQYIIASFEEFRELHVLRERAGCELGDAVGELVEAENDPRQNCTYRRLNVATRRSMRLGERRYAVDVDAGIFGLDLDTSLDGGPGDSDVDMDAKNGEGPDSIVDFPDSSSENNEDSDRTRMSAISSRMHRFYRTIRILVSLGLETLCEQSFLRVAFQETNLFIRERYAGVLDKRMLGDMQRWLKIVGWGWLRLFWCCREDVQQETFLKWCARLEHHSYTTFCDLRIDELWDSIVDYPDSEPALLDLKECLTKTGQRRRLVQSLGPVLERRLLHPGAGTKDILSQYISCVKCLRLLDPSGVLLDVMVGPIREYLRTREDAIRCIVTLMVDDGPSGLLNDLAQGNAHEIGVGYDENYDDPSWMPNPVDEPPSYNPASRSADLVTMLVNIYETKDLFIKEFQTLLADRLLAMTEYNTDNERRNLELLKLRFGENSMQYCDIMVKDLMESKRTDSNIAEYLQQNEPNREAPPFHAAVLSRLFWPVLKEENFNVPPNIQSWMAQYAEGFKRCRQERQLQWIPYLGTVTLELDFEDGRKVEYTVTPAQATVIQYFQEQKTWTLDEMAGKLETSPDVALPKLTFWEQRQVLRKDGTTYVLVENAAPTTGGDRFAMDTDESSAVQSAQEHHAQEIRMHLAFIMGMLTNFGTMALDRIQSNLTLYADGYAANLEQLRDFLSLVISEEKVELVGGMYRLKKS